MRRLFETIAMLVIISCFLVVASAHTMTQSAYAPGNLLRLHVVASSDDDIDQDIKLDVRDAVMEFLTPILGEVSCLDEARNIVTDAIPDLEAIVRRVISDIDEQQVRVELGKSRFPARTYQNVFVGAGEYEALVVTVGDGGGSNWWCVLFPPLCFSEITSEDDTVAVFAYAQDSGLIEYEVVNGEVKLVWWTQQAIGELRREFESAVGMINSVMSDR